MTSVSTQDSYFKKFLNLDLNAEYKFISIKQKNNLWQIKAKNLAECKDPEKTIKSQILKFELLDTKLRSKVVNTGVTDFNETKWKLNCKVNALFSKILTAIGPRTDIEEVRQQLADALDNHLETHIRIATLLRDSSNPFLPKTENRECLSTSSDSSRTTKSFTLTSSSPPKIEHHSKIDDFSESVATDSKPFHSSVPSSGSGKPKQSPFRHETKRPRAHSRTEKTKQEFYLKTLNQTELKSCLTAWKDLKKPSYRSLSEQMKSDPISRKAYVKIKTVGLYEQPSAGLAIQHLLGISLKSLYKSNNMAQDYIRQLDRIQILDENDNLLWVYKEQSSETAAPPEKEFIHQASEFRKFLSIFTKMSLEPDLLLKNGSQGSNFHDKTLFLWDTCVSKFKSQDLSSENQFEEALEVFWNALIMYQTKNASENITSMDQLDLDRPTLNLACLIAATRQSIYVNPTTSLIFLFPHLKLKIINEPYFIKYKFKEKNNISISTSRQLYPGDQKYNIERISINIEASTTLALIPEWTPDITIQIHPKPDTPSEALMDDILPPFLNMGLKPIIRKEAL